MGQLYKGKATFPYDVPVPGGTTDFSQFILGAQNAGVGGVELALGEQEATQVVKAGQQLGTDLLIGSSLGTFSHDNVADYGDFAKQMVFLWSYPPATADLPVYKALRADLAASGDEALQPANLKASPMRSWIGLYALLKMIRDAKMQTFTRDGITAMLKQAEGRAHAEHLRWRELDAEPESPGALQAGAAPTTGRSTGGTPTRRTPPAPTGASSSARRSASTRCCAARSSVRRQHNADRPHRVSRHGGR